MKADFKEPSGESRTELLPLLQGFLQTEGKARVLKGFFENSSGSLNSGYPGSSAVSLNALTNAPMGEHVTAGEEWSADIFSWCDLADNFDAYLTVFAHRL